MNNNNFSLSFNEKVTFELRSLFANRGYSQYKMSKFEEYDLYAKNKDFLISDSVITFTDTNGKLMALKPDVTLSIIKNIEDKPDSIQKVFYNENVYRISKGTETYKEIMQTGLECFGDIDNYNLCEVITLACKSLKTISNNCVLDISHLGIINALLNKFDVPEYSRQDIFKFLGEKNPHELTNACKNLDINEENIELLKEIASISGKPDDVINSLYSKLSNVIDTTYIDELSDIVSAVEADIRSMINIDFSVISDTHYYNNIVFKGFIESIPASVLSGGQYDNLMKKMKRKSKAVGFAVYLDMLEMLNNDTADYDVDYIVLYDDKCDTALINSKVSSLLSSGNSVYTCKKLPDNIKYNKCVNLTECEVD